MYKESLRPGWTTGACAAAAAKAAFIGLLTGTIPSCVNIILPKGNEHTFLIKRGVIISSVMTLAVASVIKDAGDDPDITHGSEVIVMLTPNSTGKELVFQAGEGVGVITNAGFSLEVGEPAINPGPRSIIYRNIASVTMSCVGFFINISIVDGILLAQYTLNPKLGVLGGLSILGTTGIVVPYSCSAWIISLYQETKIVHSSKLDHIIGVIGYNSEIAIHVLRELRWTSLVKTGNFVDILLQSIHRYPVVHLILSGGFSKLSKISQGILNLHSKHYQLDLFHLAHLAREYTASSALITVLAATSSTGLAHKFTTREDINILVVLAKRIVNIITLKVSSTVRINIILFAQNRDLLVIEQPEFSILW